MCVTNTDLYKSTYYNNTVIGSIDDDYVMVDSIIDLTKNTDYVYCIKTGTATARVHLRSSTTGVASTTATCSKLGTKYDTEYDTKYDPKHSKLHSKFHSFCSARAALYVDRHQSGRHEKSPNEESPISKSPKSPL